MERRRANVAEACCRRPTSSAHLGRYRPVLRPLRGVGRKDGYYVWMDADLGSRSFKHRPWCAGASYVDPQQLEVGSEPTVEMVQTEASNEQLMSQFPS